MHKLYITIAGNDAIFTAPFFKEEKGLSRPFEGQIAIIVKVYEGILW